MQERHTQVFRSDGDVISASYSLEVQKNDYLSYFCSFRVSLKVAAKKETRRERH